MKILPPYYGSVFIMRKAPTCKGMRHIDLWKFKSMKSGKTYLVDVEAYEKHIYGIKFYLKSQAHLQEKYSFQTNDFEPRRIVLSCIYIMKHYYETDVHSSFAFIGANNMGEDKACTKRFRFYRTIVNTYFGTKTFEHHTDERNSAYLMLRKTELDKNTFSIKDIENFFRDIYMLS